MEWLVQVIAAPKNHHFWANLNWLDLTSLTLTSQVVVVEYSSTVFPTAVKKKKKNGQKIAIINCEYLGDPCFNWTETSWYISLDHVKHILLKLNWKKNVEVLVHLTFNLGLHCDERPWKTKLNVLIKPSFGKFVVTKLSRAV